jgi:hypothetical protein
MSGSSVRCSTVVGVCLSCRGLTGSRPYKILGGPRWPRRQTYQAWFSFGASRLPSGRSNQTMRPISTILAAKREQSAKKRPRVLPESKSVGSRSASVPPFSQM